MGIREAFNGFVSGLRNAPQTRPPIEVAPGLGQLEVVDTTKIPTQTNVPGSWSRYWLGPGQPFSPTDENARTRDKETEPRSIQYITGINSTLSPRLGYGLLAFSDLRNYAETVPEVAMCIRLLTEEMKAFVPTIVDASGTDITKTSPYRWMTERPDRFNPFPVWLSRFLYNVLVYDAGCTYLAHNSRHKITSSRVVDGSTIFVLIDEHGEQPMPPAPAFQQIIWGVPKMYLNRNQLWYKPRHLRADAPYGRSPIEDSLQAVKLLSSLWEYEYDKYQVGNIPEMVFSAPPEWKDSVDKILEFEETYNARMAGNSLERVRARFMPAGVTALQTKEMTFNRDSYDAATNAVRMSFGIIQSEVGEGPSAGLGGKGYAEAMQSAFYRMGLAPLISYGESHFNDIIHANGDGDTTSFKLEFPPESLDPQKEEEKYSTRFQIGGITRDEYRQGIKMSELGGEEGKFIVTPGAGGGEEDDGGMAGLFGGGGAGKKPGMINVKRPNNIQVRRPVKVMSHPLDVLNSPVGVSKGDGAEDMSLDSQKLNLEALGNRLGVDWSIIDADEFASGVKEEMEHLGTVAQSQEEVAQIALDHLKEDPHYYSKLRTAFGKYEQNALKKYCGVDPEDDILYGSAVVAIDNVDMPHQGANGTKIVSIGGGEVDARPAVWKPADEENPKLVNWVHGPLYRRAEAAYLLDRELSPDEKHYLVPVSFIATLDETEGSVQHYVLARKPRQDVEHYSVEYVEQAAVLDYIMGQVDRVNKNYLTHPHNDHRPVFIDNDLSFSPDPNQHIRSSFVSYMAGKPLSEKALDSVYTALGNHDLWEDLYDILDDQEAVANAMSRAQAILDLKTIPNPDHTTGLKKPIAVVKAMQKADWEEEKHPRSKNGEFAPKGEGESGGGPQAPESGERVGTSTYERAKRVAHRAQQVIDARHAQGAAGSAALGHGIVNKPVGEKKPEPDKDTEAARMRIQNIGNRDFYRALGIDFLGAHNVARDNDEKELMRHCRVAAAKLELHYHAMANNEKDNVLANRDLNDWHREVVQGQDYIVAWKKNDIPEMNRIRHELGFGTMHISKPPEPKPATPAPIKREVKFQPKPPDEPGGQKQLVKNPVRDHVHWDTAAKMQDIRDIKKFVAVNPRNVMEGVSHIEFYGKICQSGEDYDHANVIFHVRGELSEVQKEFNRNHFEINDVSPVVFVNDLSASDARWVEKIRRDNRDQRLGMTSIHEITKRLGVLNFNVEPPQTTGGTHGEEALKLKNNPQAHIWDNKEKLAQLAAKQPAKPAGGAPVAASDAEAHIAARKFTSEEKRTAIHHFATGEIESKHRNGNKGINSSYWVKIKDDGEGLMKPVDTSNNLEYGMPETDVLGSDIAENLGFGCVPATGYRYDTEEGKCSVMEKMKGVVVAKDNDGAGFDSDIARETASQMMALTILTCNTDRHGNNFMVNQNTGEFIAIDNGFTCCQISNANPSNFKEFADKLADWSFKRARDTINSYTPVKDLVIKKEHVDAAEAFVRSQDCDKVLAANFSGKTFCDNLRKYGNGYKNMSDDEITATTVKLAKIQLEAGLRCLENNVQLKI